MFMVALALLSLAAALLGLWLPLFAAWQSLAVIVATAAWWWAGLRGLVPALVMVAAVAQGNAYRAALPEVVIRDLDLLISGCIESFPRVHADASTFAFGVQAAPPGVPSRLRLVAYAQTPIPVAPGCMDLLVRLKPAHGQATPGAFDREIWLFREGIAASGYVRPSRLNRARPDLRQPLMLRLRNAVKEALQRQSGDQRALALLAGLVIGDRSGIVTGDWDVLRRSGTTHLVAISGLHIALIAGVVAGLWRLLPLQALSGLAGYAAVATALGYASLAGWSVPTSRAALMVVVFALLASLARRPAPFSVLGLVAVSALLADPRVVLNPGFGMSYLAVAVLLGALPVSTAYRGKVHKLLNYINSLVCTQARLGVGLLLPNLLLFAAWSPLAPLINLLAIPVFSLMLLPAVMFVAVCAVCVPPLAAVLQPALELLLVACLGLLHRLTNGIELIPRPSAAALVCLLVATMAYFLARSAALRGGAILLLLLVLWGIGFSGQSRPAPTLRLDVLDVGQGTAVLVRTRGHALLIDTGPAWPGGDSGQTAILPFLSRESVTRLDAVLLSHMDNDHKGGLRSVLERQPKAVILAPQPLPGIASWRCRRGMQWRWDGVVFEILHPRTLAGWSENDASCVLRVTFGRSVALFPGDIEQVAETVLVASVTKLRADVVITPHHGSRTSSSQGFVQATRPRYVIHTTAFWNRWRFPATDVVSRWQQSGACQLNTAVSGTLTLIADEGGELQLAAARKASWLRPAALRNPAARRCMAT